MDALQLVWAHLKRPDCALHSVTVLARGGPHLVLCPLCAPRSNARASDGGSEEIPPSSRGRCLGSAVPCAGELGVGPERPRERQPRRLHRRQAVRHERHSGAPQTHVPQNRCEQVRCSCDLSIGFSAALTPARPSRRPQDGVDWANALNNVASARAGKPRAIAARACFVDGGSISALARSVGAGRVSRLALTQVRPLGTATAGPESRISVAPLATAIADVAAALTALSLDSNRGMFRGLSSLLEQGVGGATSLRSLSARPGTKSRPPPHAQCSQSGSVIAKGACVCVCVLTARHAALETPPHLLNQLCNCGLEDEDLAALAAGTHTKKSLEVFAHSRKRESLSTEPPPPARCPARPFRQSPARRAHVCGARGGSLCPSAGDPADQQRLHRRLPR